MATPLFRPDERAHDLQLKPYQEEGVRWLKDHDRALLADEAGLGKSAQLLAASLEPVLIVAPAMVLDSGTWDDEIEKWAPGIDATQVAYSSIAQRGPRGRVPRDGNGFPLTPPKPEYADRRWGTVILDEAHYVKGRKTNWSVACEQLRSDRVLQATGTPIPNWAHEAFMNLRLLYPEESRAGKEFGSYWRWVSKWFNVDQSRFNPQAKEIGGLLDGRTWDQFYEENWRDRLLQRLREEVLQDLPPLTWTGRQRDDDPHEMWYTRMTTEQARIYRQLKRDFVAWLDSGEEISAWSQPGLLVKLAKVATGLQVIDPSFKGKGSGKLDALRHLLKDRPRQTLVVAHFRDSVEACAREAKALGLKSVALHGGASRDFRKSAIRSFQQGNIDVLCASIELISEGMTLHQGGCDQIIRVERSFRPSKNEQVIRRIHRIGQERPVTAIDLVADDTYELRVNRLLQLKTDEQMHALGRADYREMVK